MGQDFVQAIVDGVVTNGGTVIEQDEITYKLSL